MTASELEEIHRCSKSWFLGVIYFAPRDPRMVVRKRLAGLGWTVNFARPLTVPFLVLLIASFCGGLEMLGSSDLSSTMKWGGVLGMIAALICVCGWLANPRRYTA